MATENHMKTSGTRSVGDMAGTLRQWLATERRRTADETAERVAARLMAPSGGLSYSDGVMVRDLLAELGGGLVQTLAQGLAEARGETLGALTAAFEHGAGGAELRALAEAMRETVRQLDARLVEALGREAPTPQVNVEARIDARQEPPHVTVVADLAPVVAALEKLTLTMTARRPSRMTVERDGDMIVAVHFRYGG